MKHIPLANTGKTTSQLGFGCSSLMGAVGRKESLALLEHAFQAGIRHFDVAPMYGYGAAEGCLGEFLARHPGQVTVTTKYGIPPPANQGLLRAARRAVAPLVRSIPSVKKRLASAANSMTAMAPKAPFTPADARTTLEHSLRELRSSYIDVWLLHEAEAEDLHDEGLLGLLQALVQAGTIGTFGCGSSASKVPALLVHRPAYCPVLQFEWSVLDKPLEDTSAFTMHHRALTEHFTDLRERLRTDLPLQVRWSAEIGADLGAPGILAALMLKAALVLNPQSVLLVSSRNEAHITENVRVAEDDTLADPARRLYEVAQREAATVLTRSQP